MTETVLQGDEFALLIGEAYKPSIQMAARWVRWHRENPDEDPILWGLYCQARAWGTLPTVWSLRD